MVTTKLQPSEINLKKIQFADVEYYLPKEAIPYLESVVLKNKPASYKPKSSPPAFHSSYFLVLKTGEYGLVSGLSMEAFLLREMYEGRSQSASPRLELSTLAANAIVKYIKEGKPGF